MSLKNKPEKRTVKHQQIVKLFVRQVMIMLILFFLTTLSLSSFIAQNQKTVDTDGDSIADDYDSDDDNDGYLDTIELEEGTDPLNSSDFPLDIPQDTDGDRTPDSTDTDDDNDGLTDLKESQIMSDPKVVDTDTDRLMDYKEVQLGTDPIDADTDKDGFKDGDEVYAQTDPLNSSSYPLKPIARAGEDKIIFPDSTVAFSNWLCIGTIKTTTWDFDASDGIQVDSREKKPQVEFSQEGIYTVTITVSDGKYTDSDTCLVIVDKRLAAEMDIIRNREMYYKQYLEYMKFSLKLIANDPVTLEVNGSIQTNTLILITLDPYTMMLFEDEDILIKLDGIELEELELEELIDPENTNLSYNLSISYDDIKVIFNIPISTEHIITIEKIKRESDNDTPKSQHEGFDYWLLINIFIIILLAFIVVAFLMAYSHYSINKTDPEIYHNKLSVDDDDQLEVFKRIKSQYVNWEDYDSEK